MNYAEGNVKEQQQGSATACTALNSSEVQSELVLHCANSRRPLNHLQYVLRFVIL